MIPINQQQPDLSTPEKFINWVRSNIPITLPNSGVIPGNYNMTNISVNNKGIIISASNGDSLAIVYAIALG